jgi:hypothetical protein
MKTNNTATLATDWNLKPAFPEYLEFGELFLLMNPKIGQEGITFRLCIFIGGGFRQIGCEYLVYRSYGRHYINEFLFPFYRSIRRYQRGQEIFSIPGHPNMMDGDRSPALTGMRRKFNELGRKAWVTLGVHPACEFFKKTLADLGISQDAYKELEKHEKERNERYHNTLLAYNRGNGGLPFMGPKD